MTEMRITLRSPDGDEMIVHPEREATHGVYLAEGQLKGDIIDAPVQVEYDSTAMQEGGTQRGVDYEYRDITLGFHVTENSGMDAEEADSMLRQKFDYEEDEWDPNPNRQTVLEIDTDLSGTRCLDLLMSDTPISEFDRDPIQNQYFNPQFVLRAGQPMWYEPARFKTTAYDFASGDHTGSVEVENRTDRAARHSWVISAGIGTKVWLPDVSWVGAKGARVPDGVYADRMLQLPTIVSEHGGGFRVTLERGKIMVRDFNNTNVLGQMPVPGSYFMHRIPHYTRKQTLPVLIEDCPAGGGRVELRMPLLWSRPLGLEMW